MNYKYIMFYTVYKITNNINGKIYIGCHKTKNINDDYMGSGIAIKRAIKKYGIDSFTKEIIKCYNTPNHMHEMEATIVNEDFCLRNDTYNISLGGRNSVASVAKLGRAAANANGAHIKGSRKHCKMLSEDSDYREWWLSRLTRGRATFLGQTHTDETKERMSKAHKGLHVGKKNSNYGNCWIYNLTEKQSKLVPKTEIQPYLELGWIRGRKIKF